MADPKMRFDTIVKNLRENNHKLTPQRLAIVKIILQMFIDFFNTGVPFTAG